MPCVNFDDCASWKIRLSEVSNYCEDFSYIDYRYSEGEIIWYEMSYRKYYEDCLDYGEIDEYDDYLEKLFSEKYAEDK